MRTVKNKQISGIDIKPAAMWRRSHSRKKHGRQRFRHADAVKTVFAGYRACTLSAVGRSQLIILLDLKVGFL